MRRLFFGCLCAASLFFVLFVSSAGAVDIVESQEPGGVAETPAAGFQAGTCTKDPTAKEVEEHVAKYCSSETPELFFKQAAGHPGAAFTQILVKKSGIRCAGRGPEDVLGRPAARVERQLGGDAAVRT